MAEKVQTNGNASDKDGEDVETENVVDETEEGKRTVNGEEVHGEDNDIIPERKESNIDRFLGWFRGRTLKDDDDDDDDEKNKNENKTEENETNDAENDKKVNEEPDEKESETLNVKENGIDKESEERKNITEAGKLQEHKPSPERSLLIIEEEGKRSDQIAPLAQEEEEDIEGFVESRPNIDRFVIAPRKADAVEAERETTEKEALPQDNIDANTAGNSKSATTFVLLSRPDFERRSEEIIDQKDNRAAEHDDRPIRHDEKLVDAQQAVPEDNKQDSKMEDVIEEKRHDVRTESMHETWKKVEELEPNETHRVSYTMTTTTIEKSDQPETKPADDDDDDDEKLFGRHVLLENDPESRKKYDGPPPQDLEPVLGYEEAKKDESGSADIDKIFEMMKNGGTPSEGQQGQQGQQVEPETPEDIFLKLHNWDKEPTDWWTSTKKKRHYEEWMKPMKEGTIRRVIIPKVEIPYDACVRFVTDWKYREEWDKTFSEIKILKDSKDSKLIYCPVKKHDLAFETLDRKEDDPPCYVMTWKRQMIDKEGQDVDTSGQNHTGLQLITHSCGIILRPSESGDQATYITILCQLEGPVDRVLKNTYLAGHPKSWLRSLNKYYKKQCKGAGNKVVYL